MAGISIQLDHRALKTLQDKLNTLAELATNLKPALDEIGDYLVSETTQRFTDSVSPDGQDWKAVKRGGKPLVDKGHLRDSINYQTDNTSVEIGSNLIYAAIHQLGGQTGRGHKTTIVPRPFLGINFKDEQEIGDILIRNITQALN